MEIQMSWKRMAAWAIVIALVVLGAWKLPGLIGKWRGGVASLSPASCGESWKTSCRKQLLDAKTLTLRDQVQKQIADGKIPATNVVPNCDKSDLVNNGDGTWNLCECPCALASSVRQ
jgi:hypothetical protein